MIRKTCLMSLTIAVVAVLSGCAENKLTRHNYDMIKEGQSTQMEVQHTMGEEHLARRGNQWEYEDMDNHLSVVFYFNNRNVVERKEWIDATSGEWDGAAPHIDKNPEGEEFSNRGSTTTIKKN